LICARALALAAAAPSIACSSPADPHGGHDAETCPAGFLGDSGADPQVEVQVLRADNTIATIQDGDSVPMLLPPQGGRVIFAGVRATNVDGCALELRGALRDLATSAAMFDMRTINLIPTGDGWGASATAATSISEAIASFSNIPTCPNNWSSTDVYGHIYGLEVTIIDRAKRQSTKTVRVTPQCGQPENIPECMCICSAGYVTGQACGDGGSGGGDGSRQQ
jgi:hypothetical protein